QLQAGIGDLGPDHAAIVAVTPLMNQLETLEAVEQPRNIGIGGDHAPAYGSTCDVVRLRTTENAEHVVLGESHAPSTDSALGGTMQKIGASDEVEENLFLQAGEGLGLLDLRFQACHAALNFSCVDGGDLVNRLVIPSSIT